MEANFFRFAVEELCPKIKGLRIQKVYMPAPGVWTFSFGGPLNLIFFYVPKGGGFFLSPDKPSNPQEPPAHVMWLRKRIKNQKIINCVSFWPWRRMAFELSVNGQFLMLDICRGVFLESGVEGHEFSPVWPGLDEISVNTEIWRKHPHITPPLRDALSGLNREDAERLLNDLKQGKAQGYYLYQDHKGRKKPGCFLPGGIVWKQSFDSALEAARAYGLPKVQKLISDFSGGKKAVDSESKRLRKNLAKIEKDRERLIQMVKDAESGDLIKSHLHNLDSGIRMNEITLDCANGGKRTIRLDPGKTVLENMQIFFKKAAKGRRGLDFIRKREKELQKKIENIPASLVVDHKVPSKKNTQADKRQGFLRPKIEAGYYRSSDGFIILRARNRQAGHKLLSTWASPHDLWFHVQDGPGAHVILKRAHELVEVPERSLEEAANLAALASYRKNDLKATVYCARVRDVRKIKGLTQGRVHVDKPLKSILVSIDPEKEAMLKITD